MGVIYKLKEDVVQFIVTQRQSNPLASCRQLAESASQKFGLHLSKSSVHDVLKESGIITPRGRKPKEKFVPPPTTSTPGVEVVEIPQEKRDQIQASLSQVKLLPDPTQYAQPKELPGVSVPVAQDPHRKNDMEISPEYEGAGKVFFKAVLWDLGIFSEGNIKETDWDYYLTYSKGIKVVLENSKNFFIEFPLPLERCIKEVADGLINNVKPFILHKVSDEDLFKACMDGQAGFKISSITIVDEKDHVLLEFSDIMELNRIFSIQNRVIVESNEINLIKRANALFFPQVVDNNDVINNMMNLKGFDATNKDEKIVTLLIDGSYENKVILQSGAEKLNEMYLRDEQDRLLSVKIGIIPLP